MHLQEARGALEAARQRVTQLQAAPDPEQFLRQVPSCLAALDVVTGIVDRETKGHRAAGFDAWWNQIASDSRHQQLHEIRNLTFKEAHDAVEVKWRPASPMERARATRTGGSRATGARDTIQNIPQYLFKDASLAHPDVRSFVQDCLSWLDTTVLPTAERLTA